MRVAIRFRPPRLWQSLRERVCSARGHGLLLDVDDDRLAVWCEYCGYQSPGLELETHDVRYAWMWERHRIRFQTLRRNGRRKAG